MEGGGQRGPLPCRSVLCYLNTLIIRASDPGKGTEVGHTHGQYCCCGRQTNQERWGMFDQSQTYQGTDGWIDEWIDRYIDRWIKAG